MSEKTYDYILRPHHLKAFLDGQVEPSRSYWHGLSEDRFVEEFRKARPGSVEWHSREAILGWREVLYALNDNPDARVKYENSIRDSACAGCDKNIYCGDPESPYYIHLNNIVEKEAIAGLPDELVLGEVYTVRELRRIAGVK